jgi:hypothetical protein
MKSIWWLTMALLGSGLVTMGAVVHAMRPYYRLAMAGGGLLVLALAVLGAAATARGGGDRDDE